MVKNSADISLHAEEDLWSSKCPKVGRFFSRMVRFAVLNRRIANQFLVLIPLLRRMNSDFYFGFSIRKHIQYIMLLAGKTH